MPRKKTAQPSEPLPLEMELTGTQRNESPGEAFENISLLTSRGAIACRYYAAAQSRAAVLWLCGAIGGFHSPALGLYPDLAKEFVHRGMASLQIQYRHPSELDECTLDALAGITFLQAEGIGPLAVVGHSFGGAVAIVAASLSRAVRTVVALATQSYGADVVRDLKGRCSILLMHGLADEILPPRCSEWVHAIAAEPKKIVLLPQARHGLDEAAEEVHRELRQWIPSHLESASAEA